MVESSESSPKSLFLESCSINPKVTPCTPCDASWILYNSRWQFWKRDQGEVMAIGSARDEGQVWFFHSVAATWWPQMPNTRCFGGNISGKDGDLWKLGRRIHIPLEPITRMVPLSGGEDCCIACGPKRIHQNENGTWNRWNWTQNGSFVVELGFDGLKLRRIGKELCRPPRLSDNRVTQPSYWN